MPSYTYFCETNGQVVELAHRIGEAVRTWGELCERVGRPPGGTPTDAAVRRLPVAGHVVHSHNLGSGPEPACSAGSRCCGGGCQFD